MGQGRTLTQKHAKPKPIPRNLVDQTALAQAAHKDVAKQAILGPAKLKALIVEYGVTS